MNRFTFKMLGRTLSVAAAVVVGAVCWLGCGENDNPSNSGGSVVYGDPLVYGGQTYKTVKIGGRTWMAENMNIVTDSSWCYNDSLSYCKKYGRLYNWNAAMKVCPSGWHLPTRDEWGALAKTAGGTGDYGSGGTAGTVLKSSNGWMNSNDNGTDDFGFSALPGGYRNYDGDDSGFYNVGDDGLWWTATETAEYLVSGYIYGSYYRYMGYGYFNVGEAKVDKRNGYSVRCVMNA